MRVFWRDQEQRPGLAGRRFSLLGWLRESMLPEGFPSSVRPDYLAYQKYDTLQALASSLAGALSTAGMLRAAGVGDAEASALAAALSFMLGDGAGMAARVFFAWARSAALDAYAKQFRLLADVANDGALMVGVLATREFFFPALVVQSVLRAVVGVAGAATRAAVTVHQARGGRGNVADVAAKDGSQETLVNLVALVASYLLVPTVVATGATWPVFLMLTMLHIWANFKAVSALRFVHFNPYRLDLAIAAGSELSVERVNQREPVWPHDILTHNSVYPALRLGVHPESIPREEWQQHDRFVVNRKKGMAAFHRDATVEDFVCAYFVLRTGKQEGFSDFMARCEKSGFECDRVSLCVGEWRFDDSKN